MTTKSFSSLCSVTVAAVAAAVEVAKEVQSGERNQIFTYHGREFLSFAATTQTVATTSTRGHEENVAVAIIHIYSFTRRLQAKVNLRHGELLFPDRDVIRTRTWP